MVKKAKMTAPTLGTTSNIPVSIVSSDVTHPRMLLIEFLGDTPKIVFKGEWSIRNLLTIKRCLSREFKLYRRDLIRTLAKTKG